MEVLADRLSVQLGRGTGCLKMGGAHLVLGRERYQRTSLTNVISERIPLATASFLEMIKLDLIKVEDKGVVSS